MQVVGGCLGGFLFWLLGLKMPQTILDNPGLSGVFAIALGGVSGVVFVFLLRLGYWPIHRKVEPLGGLLPALRVKLGVQMGPAILMASGILAFLVLFGGGAIWAIVQAGARSAPAQSEAAQPPPAPGFVSYDIERRLRAIDETRDFLTGTVHPLYREGITLFTEMSQALERGMPLTIPMADALTAYSQKVETAFNQLQAQAKKYHDYVYLRAVVAFTPEGNPYEIVSSARNLAKNIRDIPLDAPPALYSSFIHNQHFASFGRSVHALSGWLAGSDEHLSRCRQDILALPVVATK